MIGIDNIIRESEGTRSGFSRHYLTLYSIITGMEAKSVLELGAGFSTPTILKALEKTGGTLTTCDMRSLKDTGNEPSLASENKNWTYLQGDTRKTIPSLPGPFDVVLHDGSHEWRVVYKDLKNIIPKMKQNGIILVHDTEHKTNNYRLNIAVRLALLFKCHTKVTLPYGYGLTIIRIKGNSKNGKMQFSWQKQK